ncbi:MAG: hypothetical protein JRG91_21285 [Deltaproteobacteria bacterium]|nr:hypothetical protein [Deltaproteobacteria bacterium]
MLVVEIYTNRLRCMESVIGALLERGKRVALLSLCRYTSENVQLKRAADGMGLPFLHWTAAWGYVRARRIALQFGRSWLGAHRLLQPLHRMMRADGIKGRHTPGLASRILYGIGRCVLKAVYTRELFSGLLDRHGPRLILTSRGDDTNLRFLGCAARERRIPVLDIEHGKRLDNSTWMLRDLPHVNFAVSGVGTSGLYAAAGVGEDRIHVVGSPAFDNLMRDKEGPLPPEIRTPYLLFSSSATRIHKRWNPDNSHVRLLAALDRYLTAVEDLSLVIKLHPQEYHGETADLVDGLNNRERVIVVRDVPNGPLLAGAEVQISLGSTTTIEAMLMRTPAVFVDLYGRSSDFDEAVEVGAIERVTRLEDLGDAIERAKNVRFDFEPLERYYAHRLDGRSTERILDLDVLKQALGTG